ncbi:F-box/LRR-repeat protein 4-like [Ostrea edulis]|uniref:F-box/LRR-repeat protein 4-like n=1 Tax=Ostrea edulis TaxID=37623 RepID=UPI0024AEC391|nr:F-box/LRR-repeat protein 4-like [Ostrea edulis]
MSVIRQWVSSVLNFSSQYDTAGWSASQVVGAPKVYPRYGDIRGAWATRTKTDKEFVELKYEQKVYPQEINVYETYHAGGTKKVQGKTDSGTWFTLYETDKIELIKESRIFKVPLKETNIPMDTLRVEIDCTVAATWVEIDAVELVGTVANPGSYL